MLFFFKFYTKHTDCWDSHLFDLPTNTRTQEEAYSKVDGKETFIFILSNTGSLLVEGNLLKTVKMVFEVSYVRHLRHLKVSKNFSESNFRVGPFVSSQTSHLT